MYTEQNCKNRFLLLTMITNNILYYRLNSNFSNKVIINKKLHAFLASIWFTIVRVFTNICQKLELKKRLKKKLFLLSFGICKSLKNNL